jgi:hypothetical protein
VVYAGRNAVTRSDDSGAVAIIVALLAVTLFGFGALVVDIGNADSVHAQGQSTVDAAALAGVRTLANGGTEGDVASVVKQYVAANMGITNWAGCTDPTPLLVLADAATTGSCVSTLTSGTPGVTSYQVRVKLPPRHVPSTFGGLFGVSSIAISPVAQALSGQPLPPECGPCDPALDEVTRQPKPQPPPTGLPASIRAMLPEPGAVPLAAPVDERSGCPTPGLFTPANFPMGVTIAASFNCQLAPGMYVFENTNLDVRGNLIANRAPDPADPNVADGAVLGVTLVFYGNGTLTAEYGGGITPLLASLVTPDTTANWALGDAIPGVAIVFDQCDQCDPPTTPRNPFSLGNDFDITGSIYALDGHTTWATNSGDCIPGASTCFVHDAMGTQSLIATTTTDFADTLIPTVGTDHPMVELPPSAPHLVK